MVRARDDAIHFFKCVTDIVYSRFKFSPQLPPIPSPVNTLPVLYINTDDGLKFYNVAFEIFEGRRANHIRVCVLDIPQVILGCWPEV